MASEPRRCCKTSPNKRCVLTQLKNTTKEIKAVYCSYFGFTVGDLDT